MKTTFLGQGFSAKSNKPIGDYLAKYLSEPGFHSFTGISAFASEAGLNNIAKAIQIAKKKFKNITFIIGVDQAGTSKEALLKILSLEINGYIFYKSEHAIFHPKIYLFEGDEETKLILGSSNLTQSGLFTNIESSMLFEFKTGDKQGDKLLQELKSFYKSLFDRSDANLFKIDNQTIDHFVSTGIVAGEAERKISDSHSPIKSYKVQVLLNPKVEGELVNRTEMENMFYIRLQQAVPIIDGRFIQTSKKSTTLFGTMDQINKVLAMADDKRQLPGNIVYVESTDKEEFRRLMNLKADGNLDGYIKIASDSNIEYLAKGGKLIYRGDYYTLREDANDILVDHINASEISAGNQIRPTSKRTLTFIKTTATGFLFKATTSKEVDLPMFKGISKFSRTYFIETATKFKFTPGQNISDFSVTLTSEQLLRNGLPTGIFRAY